MSLPQFPGCFAIALKMPARPPAFNCPVFSVAPVPVVTVTMCGTENMSTMEMLIHRRPRGRLHETVWRQEELGLRAERHVHPPGDADRYLERLRRAAGRTADRGL